MRILSIKCELVVHGNIYNCFLVAIVLLGDPVVIIWPLKCAVPVLLPSKQRETIALPR